MSSSLSLTASRRSFPPHSNHPKGLPSKDRAQVAHKKLKSRVIDSTSPTSFPSHLEGSTMSHFSYGKFLKTTQHSKLLITHDSNLSREKLKQSH